MAGDKRSNDREIEAMRIKALNSIESNRFISKIVGKILSQLDEMKGESGKEIIGLHWRTHTAYPVRDLPIGNQGQLSPPEACPIF